MTVLHDAIEAINSGAGYRHVAENVTVTEPLPTLTGSGHLDLRGSRITSAIDGGSLFTIDGVRITIEGGLFAFSARQGLCHFRGGSDNSIRDCTSWGSGTVALWGARGSFVSRCEARNIRGSYDGSDDIFRIVNAANARISDCIINGGGRNDSLIAILPVQDCFVDTVVIDRVGLQSFISGASGSGAGFGLNCNTANGKIVNVWMTDSYLDHTTIAGFRFLGPDAGSEMMRNVRVTNCRNDADKGFNIQAVARGAAFNDLRVTSPHFHNPAVNNNSIHASADLVLTGETHLRTAA